LNAFIVCAAGVCASAADVIANCSDSEVLINISIVDFLYCSAPLDNASPSELRCISQEPFAGPVLRRAGAQ